MVGYKQIVCHRTIDSVEDTNTPSDIRSDNMAEESSFLESSVELLPSSEPRTRLAPLHSATPSKTEGVKKLFNKKFNPKRSEEAQKEADATHGTFETRRVRTTALKVNTNNI